MAMKETFITKQLKLHGEVRKVEEADYSFESSDGKKISNKVIELSIDDDEDERIKLVDKTSDNLTKYAKGKKGTFTLRADLEKQFGAANYKAHLVIVNFEEDK